MVRRRVRSINGDDLLYRLFTDLVEIEVDHDSPTGLLRRITRGMAVWFSPSLYQRLPILRPWIVRDPTCRPHRRSGRRTSDEWASPNDVGLLRDDNSLIKGIPKSLKVQGPPTSHVAGGKVGLSWVAAHVWREVNLEELASRNPRLNSFVPNLVWLPSQIAKLSDREGSPVQEALKRVAWGLYRNLEVPGELKTAVEETWAVIPVPSGVTPIDPLSLNTFLETESWIGSQRESLRQTVALCEAVVHGYPVPPKGRIPSRYFDGLPRVDRSAVARLLEELGPYSTVP